jgi:signal transduction histidine kinase
VLDLAVKQAQARGVKVDAQVAVQMVIQPQPLVANIDGAQIAQAVTELVHNALDAKPRSLVRVTAKLETAHQVLLIDVSDDGVGMDANTLAHATDPFFSSKPAGRRLGMGLTKAQLLATAHNGRLELRSHIGKGTQAVLLLPLDSAS